MMGSEKNVKDNEWRIFTGQNDRRFRCDIATKLFHHETTFNFHMNNFSVIIVKNKQHFNNNK